MDMYFLQKKWDMPSASEPYVSIHISDKLNFLQAFENNFGIELNNEPRNCDFCQKNTPGIQEKSVDQLPQILTLYFEFYGFNVCFLSFIINSNNFKII